MALFTLSGCKKDPIEDPDNPQQTTADPLQTLSVPADADGALISICTISKQSAPGFPGGGVEVETGTAVAVFGDLAGGNFQDAGNVSVYVGSSAQPFDLEKQSNNSYVYKPAASNPQGPGFKPANSNTIPFWDVPSRDISTSAGIYGFPKKPVISSSKTITKANGYTFSLSEDPLADKILFVIASGNKYATKTTQAGSGYTSVSFSAAELSDLPASEQAIIQAVPYNEIMKVISSKNYYFINETVLTETATIQ